MRLRVLAVTALEGWVPTDPTDRRVTRSRLHAFVRQTSHRAGARECMISPVSDKVLIRVDATTGRGHVSGVKRCGSPWACPVCSPTIRQRRARELTELVDRAHSAGDTAVLVTYTMPHQADQPLDETLGALATAWRRTWAGRWAQGFKTDHQVIGSVRAVEVTWGDNGWHPHVHQVIFLRGTDGAGGQALTDLWLTVFRRWADTVETVTGRRPSAKNGLDVQLVTDPEQVGDYVTDAGGWSIGAELTAGPVKITRSSTSLTPFALLGAAAVWGEVNAAALWWEYEKATAGRHAIQASRGLYDHYQVEQVTDDEAAAPEVEQVAAEVAVDVDLWTILVELHELDRFVLEVERWATAGAAGPPPDPHQHVLDVLGSRRAR